METILETKDLVKRYRKVCAVNHVSLSIHKVVYFNSYEDEVMQLA